VNIFDPPDPRFDAQFVPQPPEYREVRYRRQPVAHRDSRSRTSIREFERERAACAAGLVW